MTEILLVIVGGAVVVACFKAYVGARLLERDPDAYAKWREAEEEKRRQRQELMGKVLVGGSRTAWGWVKDKLGKKEERP